MQIGPEGQARLLVERAVMGDESAEKGQRPASSMPANGCEPIGSGHSWGSG